MGRPQGWAQTRRAVGLGQTGVGLRAEGGQGPRSQQAVAVGWVLDSSPWGRPPSSKLAGAQPQGGLAAPTAVREVKPKCSQVPTHMFIALPLARAGPMAKANDCVEGGGCRGAEQTRAWPEQPTIWKAPRTSSRVRTTSLRVVFPPRVTSPPQFPPANAPRCCSALGWAVLWFG